MIALDTNIFIYWLEDNPDFYTISADIIKKVHSGIQPASCSVLVLSELYNGSPQTLDAVSSLPGLSVIDVTTEIAKLAGTLRFKYGVKVIDALHLASAIASGADEFITNDRPLAAVKIPKLTIRLLEQSM